MEIAATIKNIAFLGDYVPRQCGIATYTADICEAVAVQSPRCQCVVGAVNDRPESYDYPTQVRFEIDEKELDSYRRAADFLNINTSRSFRSSTSSGSTVDQSAVIFWRSCVTCGCQW